MNTDFLGHVNEYVKYINKYFLITAFYKSKIYS